MTSRPAFQFTTVIKPEHPLVRDHRVHDVRILPGVTFLDLLYRALAKKQLAPETWEVRELLFHKPVALASEFHQRVRISATPEHDGWLVRGESQRVAADSRVDDAAAQWEQNMSCELRPVTNIEPEPVLDVERLRSQAHEVRALDEAYAHARGAGIQHFDFMKGEGTLYVGDGWILGELRLSNEARRQHEQFHLHPAHLDCATLVSVFPETRTFIPLHIRSFRCGRRLGERCFVWIDRRQAAPATDELCHSNLRLFDAAGEWVATLSGLTAKRIRTKEAILSLAAGSQIAERADEPPASTIPVNEIVTHLATDVSASDLAAGLAPALIAHIARLRNCRPEQIDPSKGWYEQGLESIHLLKLVREIETWLGIALYPTLLFEYSNITSLAAYLAGNFAAEVRSHASPSSTLPTTEQRPAAAPSRAAEIVWACPSWRNEELPLTSPPSGRTVLVMGAADRLGIADVLGGGSIVTARYGTEFARVAAHVFEINPDSAADFEQLLEALHAEHLLPSHVLSIGAEQSLDDAPVAAGLRSGLHPLMHLYQAYLGLRAGASVKLLHIYSSSRDSVCPVQAALSGFLRTAYIENPRLAGALLEVEAPDWASAQVVLLQRSQQLASELEAIEDGGMHVRWSAGIRTVRRLEECDVPAAGATNLRSGGVYLITGGASGVGYLLAEFLAKEYRARLVLCGRSDVTQVEPRLEQLRALGAEVIYLRADVTNADDVGAVVERARAAFGGLHGVLHSAGLVRDGLVTEKNRADIETVLAPKLTGVRVLDAQTRDEALDFFVLFSSVAALRGNVGQSDYAYANSFLDHFAAGRERLRREGRRSGQSLSINWPFWADGGMTVDDDALRAFASGPGMTPLPTAIGCDSLRRALASGETQLALASGDASKLRKWFGFSAGRASYERPAIHLAPASRHVPALFAGDEPIAVIGLAGRYPQARDLNEFWENLCAGKDCIEEIPAQRWDHSRWYSPERGADGRAYCKWGSFLADVDKFDPLFFGITPREAEMMDPQERLFLETAWHTFEDAGYTRRVLGGEAVGVYVGVMWSQYQLWGWEQTLLGNTLAPNSFSASIANRVSYVFDLKGPSLALDTMCSSSLTALDLACEALRRGACSMALVGGVNLALHPSKYLFLSRGNFASTDGRCRSFGEGGDGYVPGEGVGAALLKPLSRALADGDVLYGVIRATAVGHGGKTSGHAVPSPMGQAAVIKQALHRAAVDPRTITYIEAHGTGTSLGDPIEIAGLKHAFQGVAGLEPFCAIGSIKSNIGHLESAAGIAGLTKVLLQMKHRALVPSLLHAQRLNPHIDFESTPFRVQTSMAPWRAADPKLPLRAGLSSFGAGGTNTHVIVEEVRRSARPESSDQPQIFPLSARALDRLQQSATNLADFMERWLADPAQQIEASLADIAFTLQTAREAMEHRLAVVAHSGSELRDRLRAFAEGRTDENTLHACVEATRSGVETLLDGREGEAFIKVLCDDRKLVKLARLWVLGRDLDWAILHGADAVRRVSLPGYPFARERHWLRELPALTRTAPVRLHPLVHRDISTPEQRKYLSQFNGDEFFLTDHRLGDEKVLPGVVALDMALSAVRLTGAHVRRLRDVAWLAPVKVNGAGAVLEIGIKTTTHAADCEVTLPGTSGIHARATAVFDDGVTIQAESVKLAAIEARLPRRLAGQDFYAQYPRGDLSYGPSLRGIVDVRFDRREALAWIALPPQLEAGHTDFTLHPTLLDSALQTVIVLLEENFGAGLNFLPFSLDELVLHASLPARFAVHARVDRLADDSAVFSLDLVDQHGSVLGTLRHLTLKAMRPEAAASAEQTLYFTEQWRPLGASNVRPAELGNVLLFSGDPDFIAAWRRTHENVVSVRLGDAFAQTGADEFRVRPGEVDDLECLLATLQRAGRTPNSIVLAWALEHTGRLLEDSLRMGLRTNFALVKALSRLGLSDDRQVVFSYPQPNDEPQGAAWDAANAAVAGFARTVEAEFSTLRWRTLALASRDSMQARVKALCAYLRRSDTGSECQVQGELCAEQTSIEWLPTRAKSELFRERGVYLISGGAAGLGFIFAQHLAARYQARVVLVARSPLTPEKEQRLAEIRAAGGDAIYVQADVGEKREAEHAVAAAKQHFGALHGVLHSAGVIEDARLFRKTAEQVGRVIGPKVHGAWALDEATRTDPLDLFVMFSSISSLRGNAGQADYAFANRFLDVFAQRRERLVRGGLRSGRTLSVNWPMWAAGGMSVGTDVQAELAERYGLSPLPVASGIAALNHALSSDASSMLVVHGRADRLRAWLTPSPETSNAQAVAPGPEVPAASASTPGTTKENGADVEEHVKRHLVALVAAESRLPVQRIRSDKPLEDYGIDSVMILSITRELQKSFGELPKTLFFEYQTLDALTKYLMREHGARARGLKQSGEPAPATIGAASAPVSEPIKTPAAAPTQVTASHALAHDDGIAIIGVAGRYPQASDLDEFWNNLKNGRDSVVEIPEARWDSRRWFHPDKQHAGTTYTKWGGFIDGVDEFDAAFFNISPREAKLMDPQERLFLETAWRAFEDAGLTRSALSGRRIGVYAGAMYAHYQLFGDEARRRGELVPNSTFANISNRVSYWFNLRGPSLTLDTMCSSSLTAIHLACEALRSGAIDAALAGGVNVSIHPQKYLELSQGKFAATDGRCRSFGAGGDGYVPGEGVGAVVLKTLARALADGDRVLAVISASALNHGGKTNGYTVPNPVAQGELIAEVLAAANVLPENVGYIEAHGTGTSLGDPIELNGLERAFQPRTSRRQFCAIGSVKSNIGHLEAAAGMAGLTKILLQLRHETIAPSLHSAELNPNIDFDRSAFYVPQHPVPWRYEAQTRRYAGLSSFGAGGANAHLLLADYPQRERVPEQERRELFVLSARTPERLGVYARVVADWLQRTPEEQRPRLGDLAYTSQCGREPMEHRLVVGVRNTSELADALNRFAAGEADPRATAGRVSDEVTDILPQTHSDSAELAAAWLAGANVDWRALHVGSDRALVSFPSYPFARKRYWVLPAGTPVSGDTASYKAPAVMPSAATLPSDFLYVPTWREEPLTGLHGEMPGTVLVIVPPDLLEVERALTTVLGRSPAATFVLGRAYRVLAPGRFEIRAYGPCGFTEALSRLPAQPERVIFLGGIETLPWSVDDVSELHLRQERGVIALFRLIKALAARGSLARLQELTVLTDSSQAVHPGEEMQAIGASVRGFVKVFAKEYPSIATRCVDTGWKLWKSPPSESQLLESLKQVLAEPVQLSGADVAWREGRRFVRGLAPLSVPAATPDPWCAGGVYLIVGGAGGLGLEFCRDLALRVQAKVALIGRREIDEERGRILADIVGRGGRVKYYQADATLLDEMTAVVKRINAELGPVRGVIHSAIVLDDMRLERMDEAALRRVLDAKAATSAVLVAALKDQPLEHVLFFSSAQALAGNEGQANYVAGCAFKDAFAQQLQHDAPYEVRTFNWGYWGSVGIVATPEYRAKLAAEGIGSIEPAEGLEAVRRVLAHGPTQVVPMKVDARVLSRLNATRQAPIDQPSMPTIALWRDEALLTDIATMAHRAGEFGPSIDALDTYARDLLTNALRELGAFAPGTRAWTLETWRAQMRVVEKFRPLLAALQPLLVEMGVMVTTSGEQFTLRDVPVARNIGDSRQLELAARYPEIAPHAELVKVCLREFPRILRGELLPQDVLFPRAGVSVLEGVYQRNRMADHYNGLLARATRAFVKHSSEHRQHSSPVKILEIGAGTGGTTALVLPELAQFATDVQYTYTDISPAFLQHGQRTFGTHYPFTEFKRLDVEQSVDAQGFAADGYDIVIATNVLHATRDIDATLEHVRRLLRPGGWLLLNELTLRRSFLTVTFGLLDGWWAYRDPHRRLSGSPLLDASSWRAALHRCGFGRVRRLAEHADEGQDVFIAEAASVLPVLARTAVPVEAKHEAPAAPAAKIPMPARRLVSPNNTAHIEAAVVASIRAVLQLDAKEEIDRRAAFLDLGVDSILAVEIINRINQALSIQLRTTDLFNYATVARLVEHAGSLVGTATVAEPAADDLDTLELLQALSRGAIDETEASELLEKAES
jgi:acyl transferase domain-containing protein/SAM-dependent methyltransferase